MSTITLGAELKNIFHGMAAADFLYIIINKNVFLYHYIDVCHFLSGGNTSEPGGCDDVSYCQGGRVHQ